MSVAEKIGLYPIFGWLSGHSFASTYLLLLIVLLLVPILLAYVGESRRVTLHPRDQFLSFFPGDLFLGLAISILLYQARNLPTENRWYNSYAFHSLVLVACIGAAIWMTRDEYLKGVYPKRALMSPAKLYHNIALYGGIGYVSTVTLVALLAGAPSWSQAWAALPAAVWVVLVIVDSTLFQGASSRKAAHAHVANWQPIWRTLS